LGSDNHSIVLQVSVLGAGQQLQILKVSALGSDNHSIIMQLSALGARQQLHIFKVSALGARQTLHIF
jgi:hypothetical protein